MPHTPSWRRCSLWSTLFLSLSLVTLTAQAGVYEQRLYRQAESAVRSNNLQQFYSLRKQLNNYPLAPYLDYMRLAYRPSEAQYAEVDRFLKRHADLPHSLRLERTYMQQLAKEGRWSELLKIHPQEPKSTGLNCLHYEARYHTGQRQQALARAEKLWMSGESRPESCDGLFTLWKKGGAQTSEKVWQRMKLAFTAENPELMRQLQPSLGSSSGYGKLLNETYQRPALIKKTERYGATGKGREVLLLGFQRFANQDAEWALALLASYQPRFHFTAAELNPIHREISSRLLKDRSTAQRKWLDGTLKHLNDPELNELRARLAVWEMDWAAVNHWSQQLPPIKQQGERWLYWQARAYEQQGQAQQAKQRYQDAAKIRGFYGFLAAQRNQLPYRMNKQPLPPALKWEKAVQHWPFLARVAELRSMNEMSQARSEWVHNIDRAKPEEKLQIGVIAEQKGWHDFSILTTIRAEAWDAIDLRFPAPLAKTYSQVAREHNMDIGLLYAISRQESALYPRAESPVGAKGLMQLMPATAKQTARKLGIPYRGESQLFEPSTNIQLGSAYLREMLDNYEGNRIYAAAAYNAGPGRVKRWREQGLGKPMDVWVEGIPFKETRNYVQNVLAFDVIYRHKFKQPLYLFNPAERGVAN